MPVWVSIFFLCFFFRAGFLSVALTTITFVDQSLKLYDLPASASQASQVMELKVGTNMPCH